MSEHEHKYEYEGMGLYTCMCGDGIDEEDFNLWLHSRKDSTIEALTAKCEEQGREIEGLESFKKLALDESFAIATSSLVCNRSKVSARRVIDKALTTSSEQIKEEGE